MIRILMYPIFLTIAALLCLVFVAFLLSTMVEAAIARRRRRA